MAIPEQELIDPTNPAYDGITIPPGLEAEEAAIFKSSVIALKYMQMRLYDEGGKLSDKDIAQGAETIAANAGDPDLRRTCGLSAQVPFDSRS